MYSIILEFEYSYSTLATELKRKKLTENGGFTPTELWNILA